jgi:hypothetical protein
LKTIDLIAHHGESADAPENTLAAFRLAWERGAVGIEGDYRLNADGEETRELVQEMTGAGLEPRFAFHGLLDRIGGGNRGTSQKSHADDR